MLVDMAVTNISFKEFQVVFPENPVKGGEAVREECINMLVAL